MRWMCVFDRNFVDSVRCKGYVPKVPKGLSHVVRTLQVYVQAVDVLQICFVTFLCLKGKENKADRMCYTVAVAMTTLTYASCLRVPPQKGCTV